MIKLAGDEITKHRSLATKKALTAVENKIPDANSLVKKTDLNAKIALIENKIPNISGLATNSALTAVENKIPDVNSLVKKQIRTKELVKLKRKLLTIIMTNTLLLQKLII